MDKAIVYMFEDLPHLHYWFALLIYYSELYDGNPTAYDSYVVNEEMGDI